MAVIRILPDQVANQIAAGEVIERPAAVVKELLENSLDAGATRIDIEFKHGGKSYIRIEDNGSGMSGDDAMLCLERHATSKLQHAEDLMEIGSFGFRGEAMPSIASVSHFTLKTRREQDTEGTEVFVNAGKHIHQQPCGMAPGTCIEVRNLFNSVPVRRKFLKTDQTESAHIIQLVRLYALAHTHVHFRLKDGARVILSSPAESDLIQRVGAVWNSGLVKELLTLDRVEEGDYSVYGAISKPGNGRSSRSDMQIFINGRPIDNRTLTYAILDAYHTYMPKGRYPAAFLFLEMDAAKVDVNVHPAKREVRFREEGLLRRFVLGALRNLLLQREQAFVPDMPSKPVQPPLQMVNPEPEATSAPEADDPAEKAEENKIIQHPSVPKLQPKPIEKPATEKAAETNEENSDTSEEGGAEPATKPTAKWRFLAMLPDTRKLALFATPEGLLIINLRAAHERVWYERLKERFAEGQAVIQPLLIPVNMEFDPVSSRAIEQNQDALQRLGIEIEPFGRHYFRLIALPEWVSDEGGEYFVRDLVQRIRERELDFSRPDLAHDYLAKLASSRALRLSDAVSPEQVEELVTELLECSQPATNPSGKPTYIEFTHSELDRKLGLVTNAQKHHYMV